MDPQYYALLEKCLQDDYVPHLPPLLDQTKPADQKEKKNLSRALSAFALRSLLRELCDITADDCAKAVVDDFEDNGIDAAHYHAANETLYLVQGKLKASETFDQADALKFCQGVKKFVRQEFDSFNQHVKSRQTELEDAVENCSKVVLVVAHIGSGISVHADTALNEFLAEKDAEDERLVAPYENFDSAKTIKALQAVKAVAKVNADLTLHKCKSISEPRTTYFGVIPLSDLVSLHNVHGTALYDRNIRTYLGHRTDVNTSIKETLTTVPESFFYLNNGVTMLADIIEPKAPRSESLKLKMRGVSVINGAQTIATAAEAQGGKQPVDISKAKVMLTIVKAGSDSDFGKAVTRARNHQNPVTLANFAALDDEQDRLRRELAVLGLQYLYKAGAADAGHDPKRIRIDEAAQAMAMLHSDPRFAVWLKKEPVLILDTERRLKEKNRNGEERIFTPYKELFCSSLTGLHMANAVLVNRFVHLQMRNQATHTSGHSRTAYKNLPFVVAWILLKQARDEIVGGKLLTETAISASLGRTFDELREVCLQEIQKCARGPLAVCRNQGETLPLIRDCMIRHFRLAADPALPHKLHQQSPNEPYPKQLFDYLVSKAPQIGNLA